MTKWSTSRFIVALAVVLAAMVVPGASVGALSDPGGTFFDDDGNEHEAAIEAIAAAGITRGCSDVFDDLYCPDDLVTRGQMAAMLRRALELPADPSNWFDDDDDSIFEGDINALAAAGITYGCAEKSFCPELPVTRAQMASFLVRALELEPAESPFVDDDGSVHEPAIASLAATGITRGCNPPDNDRFCPDEPLRRDHMASFLARAFDLPLLQPPPRPSIRLAFSGDTLIHSPVAAAAQSYGALSEEEYDFRPMFEPVRELISSADLAICHLEVPLSPTSTDLSGYPTFNAPAELADALIWAGYDGCSTASNHSMDRGPTGIRNTLQVLQGAGLAYSGMAVDEEDTGATLYQVDGMAVAHLSYTYGLNGFVEPGDQPWLVDLIDTGAMLEDAARARADGADLVVVSVHWGAEYQSTPTAFQRRIGRLLITSDMVDLVIGHHAHVVQPLERVGEEFVVYGLGNFLSNQRSRLTTQDGVVVLAEVVPRGDRFVVRSLAAVPTWVEGGSFRILPTVGASSVFDGATSTALSASRSRTLAMLGSLGVDVDELH